MAFDLLWNDQDLVDAREDFSKQVSENLKSKLMEKEKQINWVRNMSELCSRFHKLFNLNSLTVAEIRFSAMSSEYRALCVVIPDEEIVVYHDLVPKKGTYQERRLSIMRENSEKIESIIRKNTP